MDFEGKGEVMIDKDQLLTSRYFTVIPMNVNLNEAELVDGGGIANLVIDL